MFEWWLMWRVCTWGLYDIRSMLSSEVEDVRVVWLFRSVIAKETTCREPEEASITTVTVCSHGRNNRGGGSKGFSRYDC